MYEGRACSYGRSVPLLSQYGFTDTVEESPSRASASTSDNEMGSPLRSHHFVSQRWQAQKCTSVPSGSRCWISITSSIPYSGHFMSHLAEREGTTILRGCRWVNTVDWRGSFSNSSIKSPRRVIDPHSGCAAFRLPSSGRTSTAHGDRTYMRPCHIAPSGCATSRPAPCVDRYPTEPWSESSTGATRVHRDHERHQSAPDQVTQRHATSRGANNRVVFLRSDRRQPSGGVIRSPQGPQST